MANGEPKLTDMARRGECGALENRWLESIEEPSHQHEELLETLSILAKQGKGQEASTLAWTWLSVEQERSEPSSLLNLGRELFLRCGDSQDIRQEVVRLYKTVHGDRPAFDCLLSLSGLEGGKSARRALRTLDICLNLEVGSFLISRSEERAAEVIQIDRDNWTFTLQEKNGRLVVDADQLSLQYDTAPPNDFRVVVQLHPDRLREMLDTDPASLVIGILRSHHDRIDSDELAHILSPRFIPTGDWKKWWTQAKRHLKKCPHVIVEGKARSVLTYDSEGLTLEDEMLPLWENATTSSERMRVIDTYLREAKTRQTKPHPDMIKRMHTDLLNRVRLIRQNAPDEALTEALMIDQLADKAHLPEGTESPVIDILRENADLSDLLIRISEPSLLIQALPRVRDALPDTWPDIYTNLLPLSPLEACDTIAEALASAGMSDRLNAAIEKILTDFTRHIGAICWLWRSPPERFNLLLSPRELLLRMLDHLADLGRRDGTPPDLLRKTRLLMRSTLSTQKYARYRQIIEEMEPGLASTVRRTISRIDGLGQVVHSHLLRIITDTHPELIKPVEYVDPWLDDGIIFTTHAGLNKRQDELNDLLKVKIPANAKAIGAAAEHGDLSENSEYKFALEERDLLQARAGRIQSDLSLVRILNAEDVMTDEVSIGSRVGLVPVSGQESHSLTILGPWESDIENRIYNYRAPISLKLKGLRIGDTVTLDIGSGETEYRIETIENALSHKGP